MKTFLLFLHVVLVFSLLSCSAAQRERNTSESVLTQRGTILPKNNSEKLILEKVTEASVGNSISAGEYSFIVTNEYFAASGRECKSLQIQQTASKHSVFKTVCDFDGNWGYTPNVVPALAGQ